MASLPPNFQQVKQEQLQPFLHDQISVPDELEANVLITTVDKIYNWSRRSSMWPLLFGLACCAIEMIATAASRYDLARFGMEVMRPSPRQSDLMIVSGTVTKKMVPAIVRIYNQMAEPRYVLSMGACATGGGPFKEGYNVVSGIDKYIPVDVYVPGCPPTPEALIFGLLKMHEKVDRQSIVSVPWYQKGLVPICAGSPAGPGRFRPAPGGTDQRYDAEGSDRRVVAIRQRGRRQRNRARPRAADTVRQGQSPHGRSKETLARQERVAGMNQ